MMLPRYPIYIPSKGRVDVALTPEFFIRDGVPFQVVVEPQEFEAYAARYGEARILLLPENGRGLIFARNWIKQHAAEAGAFRHWQFDDNVRGIKRRWNGRRIPCHSGAALAAIEDFCDRYENVAIAGLNYEMWIPPIAIPPMHLNCRVYSCTLALSRMPFQWRSRYNDDTDICLQALAAGWCTALFNAFMASKMTTMKVKGGNTTDLYQGDGRLKMARSLERLWPGVVTTKRRFRRPQHVVKDAWRRFDTPLNLKPGIDLDALRAAGPNEYGMELVQVKPIKSESLRKLVAESGKTLKQAE